MFFLLRSVLLVNVLYVQWEIVGSMQSQLCEPVRLDHQRYVENSLVGVEENALPQRVVFKISAFEQDFVLELQSDFSFIAPGFSAHTDATTQNSAQSEDLSRCFYAGEVNSDPLSYAALSLCKGLQGAFGYDGWEYFIKPAFNDTTSTTDWENVDAHLIRRRSNANLNGTSTSRCGVDSGVTYTVAQSLAKFKHLKEQHISHLRNRSKRFVSIPRYVETLVVADESMAKFHGDDLKHYVLTLMSVAAKLYKHPTILNSINIVVVKFMVINEEEKGPKVSGNAAMTLRNFCTWQKKLNKNNDKHPEYWDTAILFTKEDLCGSSTCDTLGMADVGTMCDTKRSCSVIEDDGLPSAFTTAHELGHVFNMPHDNVKACEEVFGKLQDNHMMSPTLIRINRTSPWSPCSAAIITDYLDSGYGDCLLDQPQKPLTLPEVLPGASYGLERQCELAFGASSKPCLFMQAPCQRLWCTGKTRGQLVCQTRHFPWADGTSCGDGQLCMRGTCVEKQEISKTKLDGRWGKWGPFGTCSRTCGGGVQLSKRECDNPVPVNGGKYCQGVRVKYRSCNLTPCLDTGKSYREKQCEAYNGFNLNTNRLTPSVVWVPKYSGVSIKDMCKLICRANGTGYFYVLAPKVVDGTPCSPDSSSVCVQGKCIKAGCDGKLGSNKKFNKCGVCGGDNKNCKKISGLFTKPAHGYNFVVMLPIGASNIDIRQRGYKGILSDDNYLAVKNSQGKYLLNGNYVVSAMEKDILVKGSLLRYSGTVGSSETLQTVKPLGEALIIEVLSVGQMTPPRIRYSFYLPRESKDTKVQKKHENTHAENSVLREEGGINKGGKESDLLKDNISPSYIKDSLPSPGKWVAAVWDMCSVTCGNGLQRRMVQCLVADGGPGVDCDPAHKPSTIQVCGDPCPMWEVGDWSPCSKTCGKGFKRRLLRCATNTGKLLPREHCAGKKKPQELDFCSLTPCK
ncbi:A disintegrin and metalloproteinase with thrombospondin motifs 15-like [Myxocyprinus asiaticus]|uniref:A disintegrin and metalloproteinase with thrombospondin motifs 15-like n=1 Tax=Myxocyprinus asiaticus TaxID=70543 RepID=UPI002222B899|nr:A disintegrin and metalloproteinase with thrombospondin motifs 15-like [Myxocyprinus asiaticus]